MSARNGNRMMAIIDETAAVPQSPRPIDRPIIHRGRSTSTVLTRRSLRRSLGFLWLLDGVLQLQSFMFTKGFAHLIIAPAAARQPWFVSAPIRWTADLIARHPVPYNAGFAIVQLILGMGLLFPRTCRWALVGSIVWAGGVWYFGEGLGGLAGGHVTALGGAPGAALLYVVLALAAWPGPTSTATRQPLEDRVTPPRWIVWAWAGLWLGAAALDLFHGNGSSETVAAQLTSNASAVPSWLASFDRWMANGVHALSGGATVLVVAAESAVGLLALSRGERRLWAIRSGVVLAGLYWAVGQSFGQLISGQATDPGTGPLLILVGLAALSASSRFCRAERAGSLPALAGPTEHSAKALTRWD